MTGTEEPVGVICIEMPKPLERQHLNKAGKGELGQFGIQWQFLGGLGRDGVQGFGGTNFGQQSTAPGTSNNIVSGALNLGALGQGLNAGIINGTVSIPGIGLVTNLAFLARALETQVNANILSTPTLMTLDNEEARILVGQNIPLLTRDAKTRLMVRDGATAVIGGVFKITTNDGQSMIPGLWKIPILGNLFRSRTQTEATDELMIFITPRIIR